jgi:hypothetical protein
MFARNKSRADFEFSESFGSKVSKYIKLSVERVRRVHIVIVTPAPEKSFAVRNDFNIIGVNIMTLENIPFRIAEIIADDADDVHTCKKTRRQREMRSAPPKILSRLPNGVSSASKATEPTTVKTFIKSSPVK